MLIMLSTYKVIRDPIHNIISFDRQRDAILIDLINTATFQRLRSIRQLGLSWVAFPGAEHSRFTHALGACHLAGRVIDHLGRSHRIEPLDRLAALIAALLHDIGHGPFSHLYEGAFPNARNHEDWGIDIVLAPHSDIHQILRAYDPTLPERIASILRKKYRPLWIQQLVSSQLDVDRFDYLLRDSRMTGAQYGLFDIEWIVNSMVLADIEIDGRIEQSLAIESGRGLHSVEQHLLGRHFMYKQVYFHPTCRAADMLAKSIFSRLTHITPPADTPPALAAAARGEVPALGDYVDLDDFLLLGLFKTWSRAAEDGILRDLCSRLVNRRLFKVLDWSGLSEEALHLHHAALRKGVAEAGFDADHYALIDRAQDIPYRDIVGFAEKGKPADEIWLTDKAGLHRLSEVSDIMRTLANRIVAQVYGCYPAEAEGAVEGCLGELGRRTADGGRRSET
jgi:uncharacterized protein